MDSHRLATIALDDALMLDLYQMVRATMDTTPVCPESDDLEHGCDHCVALRLAGRIRMIVTDYAESQAGRRAG